jgi:RNA polymerase sigma-70 factor (ECF subfamily)
MDTLSYSTTPIACSADEAARDMRLLAGLGSGQPEAQGAFVRRFQRRVYGLARTILGDGSRAEEIAQEALSRACLHPNSYDPGRGSVLAWVLGMTRHLALETLRRHQARPVCPSSVMRSVSFLDQLDAGVVPPEGVSVDEHTTAVRSALWQLPIEQRRALMLAALYGYTARQISEVEAVPLATAKARIRSGLIMMQTFLGQGGHTGRN